MGDLQDENNQMNQRLAACCLALFFGLACSQGDPTPETPAVAALTAGATPAQGAGTPSEQAPAERAPTSPAAPGACEGKEGTGLSVVYMCEADLNSVGMPIIVTPESPCLDALENCRSNAAANPTTSYVCTWKGERIMLKEQVAGVCDGWD